MSEVQPPSSPGSRGDFESFYVATAQRTFDALRRAAAGDKHMASDATQEAYLAMLAHWPNRCTRSMLDNQRYLIGIAMHKLADAYRIRGREKELDGDDGSVTINDEQVSRLVDQSSLEQAVRNLIVAQPRRRRLVGVLFFLEDRSYDEIAAILDMAPSTARTHVERLRQQLKPYVTRMTEMDRGGERP